MAAKYRFKTTTHFTDNGACGVALFLGAPCFEGFGVWWYLSAPNHLAAGLIGLSGLAFLAGIAMMLVGREQHGTMEESL